MNPWLLEKVKESIKEEWMWHLQERMGELSEEDLTSLATAVMSTLVQYGIYEAS